MAYKTEACTSNLPARGTTFVCRVHLQQGGSAFCLQDRGENAAQSVSRGYEWTCCFGQSCRLPLTGTKVFFYFQQLDSEASRKRYFSLCCSAAF